MTDTKPTQTYSELTALRTFMGKPSELAAKKASPSLTNTAVNLLADHRLSASVRPMAPAKPT